MKLAPRHEFNDEQENILKKAVRLQWISIIYILSVIASMYFVMGESQALKTAWVEDLLSLIPPIAFLITCHYRNRKPNGHYPYGFHRVVSFGFIISAVTLFALGLILLGENVISLINAEHPTIGMKSIFGVDIWLGWWMLIVLVWGIVPQVILGHLKKKLAHPLHNKILYTDADMNRADWGTGVATIVGVLGVGFGFWWTDALAAIFISVSIINDGWKHLADGFAELMNSSPKNLDGNYNDLPERVRAHLVARTGCKALDLRMYEHGHVIFADVFLIDSDVHGNIADLTRLIREEATRFERRICETSVTVLSES